MAHPTDNNVLENLDRLRHVYEQAAADKAEAYARLRAALGEASRVLVDGQRLNRSELIERSGLSRRTAYQVFDEKD